MRRWIATGVLALGLCVPVAAAAQTRRALVMGSDRGLPDDEPLRFAETDAQLVAQALIEVGSVGRDQLEVLRGPTLAEARTALASISARSGPLDTLVVFVSGHASAAGAHLKGQIWPWSELKAALIAGLQIYPFS